MRFDDLVQTRTLLTYRNRILQALEAGHQLDVLYDFSVSVAQNENWRKSPKFIFSLTFPTGPVFTPDQVRKMCKRDYPPTGESIAVENGLRIFSQSSGRCADIRADGLSLISEIRGSQNGCLWAGLLVSPIRDMVELAEEMGKPEFSTFFYAEGLQGRAIVLANATYEDPIKSFADNVVIFERSCSASGLLPLATRIMNAFGLPATTEYVSRFLN